MPGTGKMRIEHINWDYSDPVLYGNSLPGIWLPNLTVAGSTLLKSKYTWQDNHRI